MNLSDSLNNEKASGVNYLITDHSKKTSRLSLSDNKTLKIAALATSSLASKGLIGLINQHRYVKIKNSDVSVNINSAAKRLGITKS